MKLSKLINEAADNFLWDGEEPLQDGLAVCSCTAIWLALAKSKQTKDSESVQFIMNEASVRKEFKSICDTLSSLGVSHNAFGQFDEFQCGQVRQGARYLWLKFVSQFVAENGEFKNAVNTI